MNGSDMAQEDGAVSQAAQSQETAVALTPKKARSTRRSIEKDGLMILKEIGRGRSPASIRARHGWTKPAYYRRLRRAESMQKQDYDPERGFGVFLRHEAFFRNLQREARAQAGELARRIRETAAGDDSRLANLHNALTAKMRFIGECEGKIMKAALSLRIVKMADVKGAEATVADLIRATFPDDKAKQEELGLNSMSAGA